MKFLILFLLIKKSVRQIFNNESKNRNRKKDDKHYYHYSSSDRTNISQRINHTFEYLANCFANQVISIGVTYGSL